jgi:hypothetical protein
MMSLTYDGSHLRVYRNGVLIDTFAQSSICDNADLIGLGGSGSAGYRFQGYMDELSVYNTDLDAENLLFLHASGSPDSEQQYPFPALNFTITARDAYSNASISVFNATLIQSNVLLPDVDGPSEWRWNAPSQTGRVGVYADGVPYSFNLTVNCQAQDPVRFEIESGGASCYDGLAFVGLGAIGAGPYTGVVLGDGPVVAQTFNTTTGSIVTDFNVSVLVNVTVSATNYFSTTTTGHNTSSDLAASLAPWPAVTAYDAYTNASLSNFTVEVNGTNTSTTTGTVRLGLNASYETKVYANGYFTNTTTHDYTNSNDLNATLYRWTAIFAQLYNGTAINNFTITYDGNTYNTTTGTVYIPLFNETATVTLTDGQFNESQPVQNMSAELTADPFLRNYTFTLFFINTLNITFRDLDTQTIINNVTLLAEGNTATYNFNTSNGNIFEELLNPDTYKLTATSTGYADNVLFVTLSDDDQQVTMYLQNNTQNILFIVRDTLGEDVSQATITITRNINGTSVTYAQEKTDFSGSASINLVNGVDYGITVTHPNYAVFADTITPISGLSPYTIRLRPLAEEVFTSPLQNIYVQIRTANDANKTWWTTTLDVTAPDGNLQWFSTTTTYQNVTYTQNVSGSNAGGIITLNITNLNTTVQNSWTVTYSIKVNGKAATTWTETYFLSPYTPGDYTIHKTLLGAAGELGVVGRGILGMLIVLAFISIAASATRNLAVSGIVGMAGVGVAYWGGLFIPVYAAIALVFAGTLIIADNALRGGAKT